MNFVPAVAYHCCLNLPEAFSAILATWEWPFRGSFYMVHMRRKNRILESEIGAKTSLKDRKAITCACLPAYLSEQGT